MAQFQAILPALNQGHSVRRDEWEPVIRMFVLKDLLMCQCGSAKPWNHTLGWEEITATDWQLAEVTETVDNTGMSSHHHATVQQSAPHSEIQPTWTIQRNNGSSASLLSAETKREIKRPKKMTRRGFHCLLTPGNTIGEEALSTLFRLWT